jgi:hypothetical protein
VIGGGASAVLLSFGTGNQQGMAMPNVNNTDFVV